MPRFTIDLSDKAVTRLQRQVQRTNDANGTSLTLRDWLVLHVREIAIAEDLSAAVQELQAQQQRDAQAQLEDAARAARDTMLADLDA